MSRTSDRLLTIRKHMKLTQVEFSKKIGTKQNVYTRYETGKLEIPDDLKGALHRIGVNLNWLLTGDGPMFQELQQIDASFLSNTIRLPIVAEIAAGEPCEAYLDEPMGFVELPKSLLSFPPPYLVFRVSGRSMEPHILSGDLVICSEDWSGMETNGKIMAFRTWEGITLKKLVEDAKNRVTWLMPINHEFQPSLYTEEDEDIRMIGILDIAIRSFNRG